MLYYSHCSQLNVSQFVRTFVQFIAKVQFCRSIRRCVYIILLLQINKHTIFTINWWRSFIQFCHVFELEKIPEYRQKEITFSVEVHQFHRIDGIIVCYSGLTYRTMCSFIYGYALSPPILGKYFELPRKTLSKPILKYDEDFKSITDVMSIWFDFAQFHKTTGFSCCDF